MAKNQYMNSNPYQNHIRNLDDQANVVELEYMKNLKENNKYFYRNLNYNGKFGPPDDSVNDYEDDIASPAAIKRKYSDEDVSVNDSVDKSMNYMKNFDDHLRIRHGYEDQLQQQQTGLTGSGMDQQRNMINHHQQSTEDYRSDDQSKVGSDGDVNSGDNMRINYASSEEMNQTTSSDQGDKGMGSGSDDEGK